jgi:3-oxoadipyl-CoA thiolase
MKAAYVVDIVRTPIGKYGGALAHIRPDDLITQTIQQLLERIPSLDPYAIEDVILGAANQAGEDNRNVARMASLLAGLPITVAGQTVNRLCASGLQSIMNAAQAIAANAGDVFLAGGVESMTRAPFVMAKSMKSFSRQAELFDTTMGWRFINPALSEKFPPYTMGETAEHVAIEWNISREKQDEFALRSQQRYQQAKQLQKFKDELVHVKTQGNDFFVEDEHPRETTLQKLSALQPAFVSKGTVTAGNSSGINDGAACSLIVSEASLHQHQLKPMARIVAMAVVGVEPRTMGIGPVPATHKALKRAGLSLADIGLIELNEAFASQSLACIHALSLDENIVNVNGGAIALGHPLGCSGARISATLLHEMKKRNVRYGLATMCVGVGQGAAIIYENV